MKAKKILTFVLAIVFLTAATIFLLTSSSGYKTINAQDIMAINITNQDTGESYLLGSQYFASFASAYNSSKYLRSGVGAIQPLHAMVMCSGKASLSIAGGVGDIITVVSEGKQFNLKSDELQEWFAQFMQLEQTK